MKRGELGTAHEGKHDFLEGERITFIGMDYGVDQSEAYVFMNREGNINWLLHGDFSWSN